MGFWSSIGDFFTKTVLPAVPVVGQIASALINKEGQQETNTAAAAEAQNNRNWQENFFQNRHQWEVEDLKAAGLNPLLSAGSTGGSVPSGAQASFVNPNTAFVNMASQISDINLKREMVRTEKSKQIGNIASARLLAKEGDRQEMQNELFRQFEMPLRKMRMKIDRSGAGEFNYRLQQFISAVSPFIHGSTSSSAVEVNRLPDLK